jgi:SAM-dependent methyltransferase
MEEDENPTFWAQKSPDELAAVAAEMHRQRRAWHGETLEREVQAAPQAISDVFVRGRGIEIGAGPRPFPIPKNVTCHYGDIRDAQGLQTYFNSGDSPHSTQIDAQTLGGVPDLAYDFVISAHVIEHLEDPIGAIRHATRVLKRGGIFILVVPDRRFTFDQGRPATPLAHVIADSLDGGEGTRYEAYVEHLRHHRPQLPDSELGPEARRMAEQRKDLHFHVWSTDEFREMVEYVARSAPFAVVGHTFVVNENIFVLRRHRTRWGPVLAKLLSQVRRLSAPVSKFVRSGDRRTSHSRTWSKNL